MGLTPLALTDPQQHTLSEVVCSLRGAWFYLVIVSSDVGSQEGYLCAGENWQVEKKIVSLPRISATREPGVGSLTYLAPEA